MDLGQELVTGEVTTVKGLGADRDGRNGIRAGTLESALEGGNIGIERSVGIRPGEEALSEVD